MGPNLSVTSDDADRYRSEGPDRKLLKDTFKVVHKDDAKEDSQKKRKNVADKGKFTKALDAANLKAEQEEEAQSKPLSPSLFDLARGRKGAGDKGIEDKGAKEQAVQNQGEEEFEQSRSQIAQRPYFVPHAEKKPEVKMEDVSINQNDTEDFGAGVDSKKKNGQNPVQELPNQPLVNPMVVKTELVSIYTPTPPIVQPVNMIDRIKEIVDQIGQIDLYSIKEGGKTETAITLNGINKMFDGARVVVSSYDTARNEFNITFENLTQQAKNLLDLPKNQEALMQTLAQRGEWIVHQVTTTTIMENRPYLDDTQLAKDDHQRDEDESQGQGRQKRQKG
ncbi:hypothetical protein [Parachlamydia acanthamoebae]|uniref:Uncharacterized protein n=2 Tax=Parachlamydia acanthamoebae TaxID=83552 RepID=F8KX51_PARAV|nr:hypothetical protein [Parachlamydia acanthamoebae]EFB41539.1 conserved hypothetical protein [Parachlamydia acanthamoebae str. Hall's coccus]KIA78759.1 hypothetical protein DB43_DK00140 [Parachlamydia acanthamoebae]CCB85518.1 putative uncharacterized protein [Parachlamydia acanthamoebae UV-7]